MSPHYRSCFGCSVEGLGLAAYEHDGGVRSEFTFPDRFAGAPGVVHGGVVSLAIDELIGWAGRLARARAVTRTLEIEYLLPVETGVRYAMIASVESIEGRKLNARASISDESGRVTTRGSALLIAVASAAQ